MFFGGQKNIKLSMKFSIFFVSFLTATDSSYLEEY